MIVPFSELEPGTWTAEVTYTSPQGQAVAAGQTEVVVAVDPSPPGSGPGDRPPAPVVVALAAALFAIVCTTLAPAPAQAADLREFNPGNIITDQVFFDEGSMTPGAVQAFLDDKGSSCVRGADGTACLRAYRMDTSSRSATTYCPVGYQGASQETAATIIYKVAQACRVNPQVLIVTLQKEMGLVRTTNPTAKMYSRAMGYGCPDNSTVSATRPTTACRTSSTARPASTSGT